MSRPKIVASFDHHDHEQLVLLAKINRIKLSDLLRKICKAYLDGRTLNLRHDHEHQ